VEQFFNKKSFEANQPLFTDKNPLLIPDGIRTEQVKILFNFSMFNG
jgi:hypothetical protein